MISGCYHDVSDEHLQSYIDEQMYRWNTREEKSSYRFHDMFKKACKHFDYCDVLSLSSVVDVEYMMFKRDVYYHWYMHNKQSA